MDQDNGNGVIKKARQGHHDAMRELYESTINYAWFVARRLLHKAADKGHAGAMFELGNCYSAMGDSGTMLNPEKAAYWYKLAALLGHEAAKKRLSEIVI